MGILENQDLRPVQAVTNRVAALQRIDEAIERFHDKYGKRPSVVQVGDKLFTTAFPEKFYPHRVGSIEEVGIFPRPDICGDWALVIRKPAEAKCEQS